MDEEEHWWGRWRLRLGMVASVAVVLLAIGAVATATRQPWVPWVGAARPVETAPAPRPEIQRFEVTDVTHVQTTVVYPQDPPVGGRHAAAWQNCGAYDTPVPNELAVHSMEHGAVWITYRASLPRAQIDTLRGLASGQRYVLVSPYGLPAEEVAVASAWGRQMRLRTLDVDALRDFIRQFAGGPQTPEPGAPCSGGVGRPL